MTISEQAQGAPKKIKVLNKATKQWHDQEEKDIQAKHNKETMDHTAKKPKPIDLTLYEGDVPLTLPSGLVVGVGMYYGTDELGNDFSVHPNDIGPKSFWIEA